MRKHVSIVQNVWIVSVQEERQRFRIHFIDFFFFFCRMHFEFFVLHLQEQASEQSHQEIKSSPSIPED